MRPTVLIIDDHEDFRETARVLLDAEGFDVVGVAGDAEGGLAEVGRLQPDLVLLDIQLPGTDGFAAADRVAMMAVAPAVVLISSRDSSAYRARLENAPIKGFLAKHELSGAALANLIA